MLRSTYLLVENYSSSDTSMIIWRLIRANFMKKKKHKVQFGLAETGRQAASEGFPLLPRRGVWQPCFSLKGNRPALLLHCGFGLSMILAPPPAAPLNDSSSPAAFMKGAVCVTVLQFFGGRVCQLSIIIIMLHNNQEQFNAM